MVNEKAKELNWQQPDLEEVCMHQIDVPAACFVLPDGPVMLIHQMLSVFCHASFLTAIHLCRSTGHAEQLTHMQGPTNPLALRRTFGQTGQPRVKLYR